MEYNECKKVKSVYKTKIRPLTRTDFRFGGA